MGRVNACPPDEFADQARRAGLNLSAVTRDAIRRNLAMRSTDAWLQTLRGAGEVKPVPHDLALAALAAGRDEPPTRQG